MVRGRKKNPDNKKTRKKRVPTSGFRKTHTETLIKSDNWGNKFNIGSLILYKTEIQKDIYQYSFYVPAMGRKIKRTTRTSNYDNAVNIAQKEYYIVQNHMSTGGGTYTKKTLRSSIDEYLNERYKFEVTPKLITEGRWKNISSVLRKNLIEFIGQYDFPLAMIDGAIFKQYFKWRMKDKDGNPINLSLSTLRNEKSSINHFFRWCIKEKKYMSNNQEPIFQENVFRNMVPNKRNPFSLSQYRTLYKYIGKWSSDGFVKHSSQTRHINNMVCNYIMVLANCSLRPSELLKVKWHDITFAERKVQGRIICEIAVPMENSKVRKYRDGVCNRGDKLQDIKRLSKYTNPDDFVFTNSVGNQLTRGNINLVWKQIMTDSKLYDDDERLVPYQLRHLYITERLNNGVDILDLANRCGTSTKFIQENYAPFIRTSLEHITQMKRKDVNEVIYD